MTLLYSGKKIAKIFDVIDMVILLGMEIDVFGWKE